ncbi:MAG: hypothetical protein WD360_05340 [Nitriliruptoraceae bacterium]
MNTEPVPLMPETAELPDDDHTVATALRSFKRLRIEILAGVAVALALIPEAISFSILAGVDP